MSQGPTPLETALEAIAGSYDAEDPLSSLETETLPNRKQVALAFEHLLHVFFLGFFTTRPLSRGGLRLALGEHLLATREILCAQVARAVAWGERRGGTHRSPGWCEARVDELLSALPALRAALREDIQAGFDRDPAAESVEEVLFSYPFVYAMAAHRLAHHLYVADVPMLPRMLAEHAHTRTGIDIHPGARIGRRFFVDHGTGVVIGATAVIGDDVTLYQGVTLGALSVTGGVDRRRDRATKRHPTLEDRVTVYAGATILGGDTVVGQDSVIGGNVWLIRSVPPGSRVFFRATETHG
jgi:serine O-acetyltransferase